MAGRRVQPSADRTARRAPRRTGVRAGDGTRARILSAATDEFAANGYSGARIEAISRAAGANPRMIYHYFGDKDGLYVAVLSGEGLEQNYEAKS